jgi:hypothetical protein
MRFRPPLKNKWFYPFLLCGCVVAAYLVLDYGHGIYRHVDHLGGLAMVLVLIALTFWVCAGRSWGVWTSRVDVDDIGVRWKEGTLEQSLKWDEIARLAQDGTALALVERASAVNRRLPFVSRPLYAALTARLKPLSDAEEQILFPGS